MALRLKQVTLGPTASDGTFSVTFNAPGQVKAVGIVLGNLSTPDVTITDALTGAAIFAKAGIASNAIFQPKIVNVSAAAAALSTAGDVAYDSPACLRTMTIALAGAGDTKTGTAYLLMDS